MEVLEAGATSATIRYTLHDGLRALPAGLHLRPGPAQHRPDDLRAAAGARSRTTSASPTATPPASTELTWDRRSRLPAPPTRPAGHGSGADRRCAASCASCSRPPPTSSAATTSTPPWTASSPAPPRPSSRPPTCSPSRAPGGGAPLVHSAGLPADDVPALAADAARRRRPRARRGRRSTSPPPAARTAGWPPSTRPATAPMGDEASMLAAYAGHAAAALDLIIALEDARQEADRAGALLALAHELSAADRRGRRHRRRQRGAARASSAAPAPGSCCGTRPPGRCSRTRRWA